MQITYYNYIRIIIATTLQNVYLFDWYLKCCMHIITYACTKVSCFVLHFVAPVCFNTTQCDGASIGNNSLSYGQCCFELYGVSFASPGQCLLCPKSGTNLHAYAYVLLNIVKLIIEWALMVAVYVCYHWYDIIPNGINLFQTLIL